MRVKASSPLCVALDTGDRAVADALVGATAPYAGAFKVGLTSFVALGPSYVSELAGRAPVFADLKLHDIPTQVAGAVAALNDLRASYVTVHASGGSAVVRAAAEAAGDGLTVLAVTLLTSLGTSDLRDLGMNGSTADAVLRLADVALSAGAGGLVCSPLEAGALRERFGARPVLVVPGIRGPGDAAGDQARTATASEALAAGGDLIVVGRPIARAADPAAAARALLDSAGWGAG